VFSPYYAWARRRGSAAAVEHCALNVALYGERANRWTMTERDRFAVQRAADSLAIGPSSLRWRGDTLEIVIDEVTSPWPSRVRGTLRLHPQSQPDCIVALDDAGRHHWTPIAPRARIEVNIDAPGMRWNGHAYLDSNLGSAPMEEAFHSWQWSRAQERDGATSIFYDVRRLAGDPLALALRIDRAGAVESIAAPPVVRLPTTQWRIGRAIRARDGTVRDLRTVEDTPFYARSLLTDGASSPAHVVHESLSLERFRSPWVQSMLPFRMPRRRSRPRK
jgi:carotenoid 1,2-hydratase